MNIALSLPGTPLKKLCLWISLNNTEILLFMFESPIFNNKENWNFAPPPARPWIYSIDMKIVIFMFHISNNKENKNENLPPWTPLAKKYFFEFLRLIWTFSYLGLKVLSLIIKKIEILPPPPKGRLWQKNIFLNFVVLYGYFLFKWKFPWINTRKSIYIYI